MMLKSPMTVVSGVLAAATLALAVTLTREKNESEEMARRLEAARSELADVVSIKDGLEEANADLRERVETLREAPPLATLNASRIEDAVSEAEMASARDMRQAQFADDEEDEVDEEAREPTPEEIAAQEERAERRRQRIEERQRRRAEFSERVQTEIDHRKAFFSQISTEGLAPEYKEAHERLMASLDEAREKMAALTSEDLSRRERWQMMREMRGDARELSNLMDMQRDVLLNDYAQQALGLDGEQTQGFIDYMKTVEEMTGFGGIMRGRGRGR